MNLVRPWWMLETSNLIKSTTLMNHAILRRRTWIIRSETVTLRGTFDVSKATNSAYNKESFFSSTFVYPFSKIWVQEFPRQVSASEFNARSFTINVISPSSFYLFDPIWVECPYDRPLCCRIHCLSFIVHDTRRIIEHLSNATNGSAAFRGCLGWRKFTNGEQPELFITSPIPTIHIFSWQPFYAAT